MQSPPSTYPPLPLPHHPFYLPPPFNTHTTHTPHNRRQIPAEIYPTEARSTCHGISAAFGKAGAAVGAAVFLKLINSQCPDHMCTKDSPPADVDRGVKYVLTAAELDVVMRIHHF